MNITVVLLTCLVGLQLPYGVSDRAKHVETVLAVVQCATCPMRHNAFSLCIAVNDATESLTRLFDGLDNDNGIDRCVVLRSWVQTNLHLLDLRGMELSQFRIVAHQTVVDIDKWRTLADDIESIVLHTDKGQMPEHVRGKAYIGQLTVLNIHGQTISGRRNKMSLYRHTIQSVVIGVHPDGADVPYIVEVTCRLITHKRASDDHTAGIRGDDNITCLIAQSAADERGIGRAEQGDVRIGHRLTLLVDNPSYQATLCLMGTLYEVLVMVPDDTDGPEAYDLHQGLFKTQTLEAAGDGKVLQVIINEGDFVAGGDSIEVFEYTAERLTLIAACDLLAIGQTDHSKQQHQDV